MPLRLLGDEVTERPTETQTDMQADTQNLCRKGQLDGNLCWTWVYEAVTKVLLELCAIA